MLCQCGCGEITTIANKNNTKYGYVKGRHKRFILGHHRRRHISNPENECRKGHKFTAENTIVFKTGVRTCRICYKDMKHRYYEENRDEILDAQREYYQENRDEKLEYHSRHYQANRERILERHRERYHSDQEGSKARHRQYYYNNRERLLEQKKKRYAANRERILARQRELYRAKKESEAQSTEK